MDQNGYLTQSRLLVFFAHAHHVGGQHLSAVQLATLDVGSDGQRGHVHTVALPVVKSIATTARPNDSAEIGELVSGLRQHQSGTPFLVLTLSNLNQCQIGAQC